MFIIEKTNKILLTKGDTASMYIEIRDLENNVYNIKDTDTITLTVRKTVKSQDISISKLANEEHYILINPEDTNNLSTGLYVYDVQLETEDGNVYTVVPLNYFELTSEVTR